MNTKTSQKEIKPTEREIMHYVLLWCYNWTQEDFKKAFKESRLGWEYFWDKLQGKLIKDRDATEAVVDVIMNMDKPHQEMLINFILEKYAGQISSARSWDLKIKKAVAEQKKKRENATS